MPVTDGHSKWVNGRLVFYEDGARHRWLDAMGPDVCKWELPIGHALVAASSGGMIDYSVNVTSSSDASAYIYDTTTQGYRLKLSTKDSDAKYAMLQTLDFPFKFEASMPLYFGIKCKINDATSTDFIAGLLCAKASAAILAAHNIGASIDGAYFLKLDTATAVTPTTESGGGTSTTSTKTMTTSDHIFEFHWDGSTTLTFYASGAELGTCTSSIDQTANLAFSVGLGCGKSAHQTLSIAWARAIQLRT